jgi:DNA polymerase-3 subunit delta'
MPWDIFAHEWATDLLRRHVATGDVRHAYLFTGPPGVGRRTMALRLAQAVNCLTPAPPGVPCGSCRACTLLERMQHPDLTIVQIDPEKSNISIDQVRLAQRSLSLAPYEGRYRVALLLNFEDATENAQNALLKTLEEPPEKVILLITAASAESLLPTIVSRCEVIRMRPAPIDALADALRARWGQPANTAANLAHLSGGRVGMALRLAADPLWGETHEQRLLDLGMLLSAPLRDRLDYAEGYRKPSRDELRALLESWLSYWRDAMLLAGGSDAPLTNLAHADDLRHLAARLDLPASRRVVAGLETALAQLDANANRPLLLGALLLEWPRL